MQSFIYKEIDSLKFERLVINQPKYEDLVGESLFTEMIACNFRSYDEVQLLRQRVLSWAIDNYQVSEDRSDVLISLAIVFPCRKFLANEKGLIETCR